MASRKLQSDKRLKSLLAENKKLYKDVEVLEDGLILHQRYQDVDNSSVRGLLRKEIGGSRWEHGGSGKLRLYKDVSDLQDPNDGEKIENRKTRKKRGASKQKEDQETSKVEDDKSNKMLENIQTNINNTKKIQDHDSSQHHSKKNIKVMSTSLNTGHGTDDERLTMLKTRVIEKVSSGVIKRKKNNSKFGETFEKSSGVLDVAGNVTKEKSKSKEMSEYTESVLMDDREKVNTKQSDRQKASTKVTDRKKDISLQNRKGNTFGGKEKNLQNLESVKILEDIIPGVKTLKEKESFYNSQILRNQTDCIIRGQNQHGDNADCNIRDQNQHGGNAEHSIRGQNQHGDNADRSIRGQNQHGDNAEHSIRGQNQHGDNADRSIRGQNQHGDNADRSIRGQIQHGENAANMHSFEKETSAKSRIKSNDQDEQTSCSDISGKWTYELDYNPSENIFSLTNNCPNVPKCDPDVKLWLRRLGLLEEEKYLQIFAANEIDMNVLIDLTFEQLQDMGVVAIGALNKILRGIKELKLDMNKQKLKENQSSHKNTSDNTGYIAENNYHVDHGYPSDHGYQNVRDHGYLSDHGYQNVHDHGYNTSLAQHIDFDFSKKDMNKQQQGDGSYKFSFVEPASRFSLKEKNAIFKQEDSRDHLSDLVSTENASHLKNSSASLDHVQELDFKNDNDLSLGSSDKQTCNVKSTSVIDESKHTKSNSKTAKSGVQVRKSERERSLTRQNSANKSDSYKKEGFIKRSSSAKEISKDRRKIQSAKSKQKKNEKNKHCVPSGVPRSKSVEGFQVQAHTAINTAAKKFEDKQRQENENNIKKQKVLEKKKQRDEMAARHIEREKKKEAEDDQIAETVEDFATGDTGILSTNYKDGTGTTTYENKSEQKEQRPLYRPRKNPSSVRHSVVVPASALELRADNSGKKLMSSTYKVSARVTKQETVKDIEQEIHNLQSKALSGEQVTMDLVKNLQQRLEKIETDMTHKQSAVAMTTKSTANQQLENIEIDMTHTQSPIAMTTKSTANQLPAEKGQRLPVDGSDSSADDEFEYFEPIKNEKDVTNKTKLSVAAVSMSKRQLMNEIKREKEKHRKQIKHLYSELQAIKHTDPLKTTELNSADITFESTDLIGQGAFSKVYKGTYQGSEVAVKQLKIPLSSQDRNYFAAEVNLLQDLRHPRVVLLFGVCTTERLPLMVLEFMARGSLFHRLHDDNSEPLDHAEYYRVAHDIALGMNYLHSHKPAVLHLDLKPMNVLICSNDRAKIADFGFSKFRHDADLKASAAAKAKPLHSAPSWMAPELLSSGEITGKADVYSFGIILWEMLTRQQPYEGLSVFQILEKVRTNKRPALPTDCPGELKDFIVECWHANPARRPSFKDILRRLENMAFPPEWQALFKVAGIPDEALEDVQSARTIISLVSSRLDMEDTKPVRVSGRKSHDSHVIPGDVERLSGGINSESVKGFSEARVKNNADISVRESFKTEKSGNEQVDGISEIFDIDRDLKTMPKRPSPRPRSSRAQNFKMNVSKSCDHIIEELKTVQKGNTFRSARTDRGKYCMKPEKGNETVEDSESMNVMSKGKHKTIIHESIKSSEIEKSIASNETTTSLMRKSDKSNEVKSFKLTPTEEISGVPEFLKKPQLSQAQSLDVTKINQQIKISAELSQPEKIQDAVQQPMKSFDTLKPEKQPMKSFDAPKPVQQPMKSFDASKHLQLDVHIPKLQLTEIQKSHDSHVTSDIEDVSDIDEDSLDDSFPTPRDSLEDFTLPDFPMSEVSGEIGQSSGVNGKTGQSLQEYGQINPVTDIKCTDEELCQLDDKSGSVELYEEKKEAKSNREIKKKLFKDMHSKLKQNFSTGETDNLPKLKNVKQSKKLNNYNPSRKSIEAWVDDKNVNDTDTSDKSPASSAQSSSQIPLPPPPPPIGYIPDPPQPPAILPESEGLLIVKPVHRAKIIVKSDRTNEILVPRKTELTITSAKGQKPFTLKSMELKDQKEALQSISKPHPNQLHDLSQVSKGTMHSIAEILKKAVSSRRIALGEDLCSPSQSVASSWSCIDD